MSKFEQLKLIISYWKHIWQSMFELLVMFNYECWIFCKFLRNYDGVLSSKSGDSKYRNFLKSKLRHGYISLSFTKFKNHLREHILSMSKSEHKLNKAHLSLKTACI